ncbi:MAG: methyltransferase domain-containing protein [Dehalococcoidia bacterium]|nr:methyltransferase domain-containing protein [Dehalococcoidia bacterium]
MEIDQNGCWIKRCSKERIFDREFPAFLKTIVDDGLLNGSSLAEIDYLQVHSERLRKTFTSIPGTSDQVSVLDIGTTPFTWFIKRMYPQYRISTIDITDRMETGSERFSIEFKRCNLEELALPFDDDLFNVIIFCEVLEHIFAPPSAVLKEIRRILRPGGKLILSVPNIAALYKRVRLLMGRSILDAADLIGSEFRMAHLHEYTSKEISALLEANNLTIVYRKYLYTTSRRRQAPMDLVMRAYDVCTRLVPPFRSFIHIECEKPS